jgi:hypothetical protein
MQRKLRAVKGLILQDNNLKKYKYYVSCRISKPHES